MRSIMNLVLRIIKNNKGSIKYSELENRLISKIDLNEVNLAVYLLKDNGEIITKKGVLYLKE